jgi:hypothetical protein
MNHAIRSKTMAILISVVMAFGFTAQRSTAADDAQTMFSTPKAAADALVAAAGKWDIPALEAIFGPEGKDIIHSGEPGHDREIARQFAAQARTKMDIAIDPATGRRAFINVGNDAWPFPVPIVKSAAGRWYFDSKAGLSEILTRRVGRNELDAIEILRGFADAQDQYAETKHDNSHVNQYAQKIISTPGKHDGLAWQNPDGAWGGPIGKDVARAIEHGYVNGEPYHGYYFKVLTGQGPDAPLGQMDYVVEGAMIGGFALMAFPAQYGNTGVMTFMVSNDGVVYQKDLGPNTVEIAKKIDRFNPDNTWTPVAEE